MGINNTVSNDTASLIGGKSNQTSGNSQSALFGQTNTLTNTTNVIATGTSNKIVDISCSSVVGFENDISGAKKKTKADIILVLFFACKLIPAIIFFKIF